MHSAYGINGLPFWDAEHVQVRDHFALWFAARVEAVLRQANAAFTVRLVEAPLLTPAALVNANYGPDDTFASGDLVLRPETTPGSYAFAVHLLAAQAIRPPLCIWQHGKSFRREQDQPTRHVRLKEFCQQEFQVIFSDDTKNDYFALLLDPVRSALGQFTGKPARVVESDRLPSYSLKTMDVEVDNGDKWMEVCSISLRTDFPHPYRFTTGKGLQERTLLNVEVAVGTDRVAYNAMLPHKS